MKSPRTIKQIHYDLDLGDLGNPTLERTICKVCQKLPENVYHYVAKRISWVSGAYTSFMFSIDLIARQGKRAVILIAPEDDRDQDLIAHEIAHAFLRHGAHGPILDELQTTNRQEKEAIQLSVQWGFKP